MKTVHVEVSEQNKLCYETDDTFMFLPISQHKLFCQGMINAMVMTECFAHFLATYTGF
jgi:hypothetical protein